MSMGMTAPLSTSTVGTTIQTAEIDDDAVNNAKISATAAIEQRKLKNFTTPVTSLPSSPVDGDMCVFQADATNGVYWMLRYRSGSGSTYKWEFLGGAPMVSEVLPEQFVAPTYTTYQNLSTVGPQVTVPLAGDYLVSISSLVGTTNTGDHWTSYSIGATAAVDADGLKLTTSADNLPQAQGVRERVKTGLAASTALVAKYRSTGAAGGGFSNRTMKVTPVRVG